MTKTTINKVIGSIVQLFASSNPVSVEFANTKPDMQFSINTATTLI
mgnify:CR=1 FL=1